MDLHELKQLCREILDAGRDRFGQIVGIVSRIQSDRYGIFAVSTLTGMPEEGDEYALNAVYCREVFQTRRTKAITEIEGVLGMELHPLYKFIPCEAYISSPILVDGEVWGTINFTGLEKRERPFSADDIAANERWAAQIASAIATIDPE